jgi:hypothetical protein
MITENSSVVLLSDSICDRGSNSRNNPAFMIMDDVNVTVHNLAAGGMPLGRLGDFAFVPIAMCDQKSIINYLTGIEAKVECLIVFGGANDWIHGTTNVIANYTMGIYEIATFARQIGIPNVVVVSPLGVLSGELNANNGIDIADLRAAADATVTGLNTMYGGVFYVDGLSLMPVISENYEADELHPSDTGRAVWVANLISNLQTQGIFPASY